MQENIKEKDDSTSIYEVSYLLLPSIALEPVPHEVDSIKEAITSRGGVIVSHEDPILIDLSYPMTKVIGTTRHKCDSGYFGWVKFEISKKEDGGIEAVKKALDTKDEILRYLIVKTVREKLVP